MIVLVGDLKVEVIGDTFSLVATDSQHEYDGEYLLADRECSHHVKSILRAVERAQQAMGDLVTSKDRAVAYYQAETVRWHDEGLSRFCGDKAWPFDEAEIGVVFGVEPGHVVDQINELTSK